MLSTNLSDDVPGLEGPDYLALIIEWNDEDDANTELGAEPLPFA